MSFNTRLCIVLISIYTLFSLSPCNGNAIRNQPLTPVTMQLKWVYEASFAGFFSAEQKGFYQEESLDVSFLPGGAEVLLPNRKTSRNLLKLFSK